MATGSGTITIDFGTGKSDVSVFVSIPTITAGQLTDAWVFPDVTSNNTVDNHFIENLVVIAGKPVASSGFTIFVKCTEGLAYGVYNIAYVYA